MTPELVAPVSVLPTEGLDDTGTLLVVVVEAALPVETGAPVEDALLELDAADDVAVALLTAAVASRHLPNGWQPIALKLFPRTRCSR